MGGEIRSTLTSTPGGVMCRGVGAVTGELEISTSVLDEGLEAIVRYAGADEWYPVEGSPISLDYTENRRPEYLHDCAVERLTTPGPIVDGNEQPVSLKGLSST